MQQEINQIFVQQVSELSTLTNPLPQPRELFYAFLYAFLPSAVFRLWNLLKTIWSWIVNWIRKTRNGEIVKLRVVKLKVNPPCKSGKKPGKGRGL